MLGLVALVSASSGRAFGDDFELLHSFAPEPSIPGARLLIGDDGAFYGTTVWGGRFASGTVFRLRGDGLGTGVAEILHVFDGSDGRYPASGLTPGPDGSLYGIACEGGAFNGGVAYKISPTGVFALLHDFGNGDGRCPATDLTRASDGALYGTTLYPIAGGTIFRIELDDSVTTLHRFQGPDGKYPTAPLVQARDGNFYGTTYEGGTNDVGTVYRMTSAGELTTLYSFGLDEGGLRPFGGLTEASTGELYGTTTGRAGGYRGTAFKIATDGAFTVVHQFTGDGTDGGFAGLTEAGGDFYGSGRTSLYRMTPDGDVETIHSIDSDIDGRWTYARMIRGGDGSFYGTFLVDGPGGGGVVFRVTPSGEFTNLYNFTLSEALTPVAGLIQGADGALYGTSYAGGKNGLGTVFRIDGSGTTTSLHSFGYVGGNRPYGGLVAGPDGRAYGTTSSSVFAIDGSSRVTVLHDASWSRAGLVRGPDGAFYGVSFEGGSALCIVKPFAQVGCGYLFRVTAAGDFAVLHEFSDRLQDGCRPYAGLIVASDGNFYGTTSGCGDFGYGTVYRMTPSGEVRALHSFTYLDGAYPLSRLLEARDGNFYGTTHRGGPRFPCCNRDFGTVFRMTAQGELTTLHDFDYGDGSLPVGDLIEVADGEFYGTTSGGGPTGGSVYRIDASGTFEVVHHFFGPDGDGPLSPLVLGSDGALYGTTPSGGTAGLGTVFRILRNGGASGELSRPRSR